MRQKPKDKTTLIKALKELGLVDELREFCKVPRPAGAIRQWIISRPELAARAFIPGCFRNIRKSLGCTLGHGGKRPDPKNYGYSVKNLRRRETA